MRRDRASGAPPCIGISQRGSGCYAVAHTGTAELADGIEAANLDELAVEPGDRQADRGLPTYRRKVRPLSQLDEYHDPAEKERVIKPVRADFFRSK